MTPPPLLGRAQRAILFARHMPLAKLARRLELDIRRAVRDRMPVAHGPAGPLPPRASRLPTPLFAPRAVLAPALDLDATRFRFLNRTVEMPVAGGVRTIDWQAPGPGTANQLWRMNLHYMEFLEGIADTEAWAAFVRDWLRHMGTAQPLSWRDSWNSYALSIRVVVWLQELARRSDLPEHLVGDIEASAVAQIRFLKQNLETDLGGNHLIKNIKALIWASVCFEGAEPKRWSNIALTLMERELRHQVLADGMHFERSPSYHAQVFADLLECRHALGGDTLGGVLDDTLARMAQAVADLSHTDGGVSQFNDAGLSMAYAPAECLHVYERIFGRRPAAREVFAFPDAGCFGLRKGGTYFVADCGRIAPDDIPAHGHGDVLSFELSAGGHRIIVDQGVFEYVAGSKRQASRSAASHNTLSLDGTDQADFFGAFRCGRRPNVEVRHWEPRTDGFVLEGSHDGFRHLPGRPVHVRRFEVTPGELSITDRIEGITDRRARISFLLHPEVEFEIEGRTARLKRAAAHVEMTAGAAIGHEVAVWWPDMGHEQATIRLTVPLAPSSADLRTHFRMHAPETTQRSSLPRAAR